jgi:hypothetical protein
MLSLCCCWVVASSGPLLHQLHSRLSWVVLFLSISSCISLLQLKRERMKRKSERQNEKNSSWQLLDWVYRLQARVKSGEKISLVKLMSEGNPLAKNLECDENEPKHWAGNSTTGLLKSGSNWLTMLVKRVNQSRHSGKARGAIRGAYAPLWFVAAVVAPLGIYAALHKAHPVFIEYNVAVTQVISPYRFTFRPVDDQNHLIGEEFTEDICQDHAPPGNDFKPGTILRELIHTEEGTCWSLNPDKHAGFYKRRDANKNPIYVAEMIHAGN